MKVVIKKKPQKPKSYVWGVDAGFAFMGIAFFDNVENSFVGAEFMKTEKGANSKSKALDNVRRCNEMLNRLDSLLEIRPCKLLCAELPHGGAQSASAMAAMATAATLIAAFCNLRNIPLVVVTPNEVKKWVKPKGAVSKDEVIAKARAFQKENFLPSTAPKEHVADAMAAAIVGVKKFYLL